MRRYLTLLAAATLLVLTSALAFSGSLPRHRARTSLAAAANAANALTTTSDKKVAFIIVDHGSRKAEANDMLLEIVRKYKAQYNVDIVEGAHMELAEPSISTAFRRCVEQGAERIVCHPFFLSRGRHVQEDIPGLLKAAADEHPTTPIHYTITEPLGAYDKILELMHHAISSTADSPRAE
jgi:sirohydrochlorin ferrochelatase